MSAPEIVPPERGMILVNVLIIVMLATAVLAIMLAGEDSDVERSVQLRAAAQGMAIARGGELSAVAALRRDLASGSITDSLEENWANIADNKAEIAGGTFTFAVTDAQARFNVNNLARADALSQATFAQLTAQAGLPPETTEAVAALLQTLGPIDDLASLRVLGIDEKRLQRLALTCTALPEQTDVNLNTAPEPVIAILLGNEVTAHSIVALRSREGGLDRDRLLAGNIILPPGTTLSSSYFWARGRVVIGDTRQQLTSLLHREVHNGTPQVATVHRWRGAAPVMAPPLPN